MGAVDQRPDLVELWNLAIQLSRRYNGTEDRYLNQAVKSGGLDFSDLAETCWILGLEDIPDARHFFERFASANHGG